ncbi:LysR family transcriptional regulator [Acidocella aminolytica]|jgi:DNA-binding transcriptional LysR family regulator|uniref:Transcriptional regulator LysR n=1 Tax=Acidocella aminolytica 101 = DSM 11237 TaxID=1120923 RepID=A0A0D6PCV1_9PROT|nr:LysR family transcriptional regulator [Acidocella aminolytica]GAN79497.1 transcriptional regulator LysR [Acidocella aminolytica 101 = DSM 11237]GBQ44337.1 transcriptional regulator [Acidocella aminolytica 101 = DSM 11237]SHE47288.1 transcriptional regulator, LysR family [Acidocella aminolytica 101 = DSM 11237]
MDRLGSLSIFIAVAEQGSFIGASRKLERSPTAVSRAVAALEDEWGVQLFTRTTRANALTKAGETYLEQARRVIAEYDGLRDAVSLQGDPSGLITITAPEMFGRMHVLPLVQDFMATNPRVEISLLLLNRLVSFIDEGVDLGFRIANLADSSLRAIRLGEVRQVLCASPDYLAKAGIPAHPGDLAGHRTIVTTGSRLLPAHWRFWFGQSERNVQVKPQMAVNSVQAALEAAVRGGGIVRALSYQVAPLEATGALRRLLATYELPPVPVQLVYPAGRHLPPRTRLFIDHTVGKLRQQLLETG